jgi:signal transduction histidine kinase
MQIFIKSDLLQLLAIAGSYLLAAFFVQIFLGGNDLVLFVWLAFGPVTAAVYTYGNRMLLGVFVGSLLGFLISNDLAASINGAARHTLILFFGAWLLRRDSHFDPELKALGDYVRIVIMACSQALLAAVLTVILGWITAVPGSFTFGQFFAGVMLSNLVGVPLFLVWRKLPRNWGSTQNILEAILILGLAWFVGQVVFLDWLKETLGQVARGYWMFLFVTWAAVRLGPHGAVLVVAAAAIQALVGAKFGAGFFFNDIAKTHLANYYFYFICLSSVGMALATYFAQRLQAMRDLDVKVIELDQANTELSRKNEEMESMIYTASHDLRSPLVNIQGFSQRLEKAKVEIDTRLAQDDVPEAVRTSLAKILGERMPAALGFIKTSSLKMDSLINGLLRLSRAGRAQLTIQSLDMNAMLDDIIATLTIQIQQANATVTVSKLPPCMADSAQLNQVLTNLIDNAIKYRDPARALSISIDGSLKGGRAYYSVADTGLGIAEEFQPKVWQLFHRLDPNGAVTGEGMGLTLVRRILERLYGHITLTSKVGEGTRFTFALPACTTSGAPLS